MTLVFKSVCQSCQYAPLPEGGTLAHRPMCRVCRIPPGHTGTLVVFSRLAVRIGSVPMCRASAR